MDVNAHLEEIAALAVSVWRDTDPDQWEYSALPESAKALWRARVRDTAFAMAGGTERFSGPERACALAIRYITIEPAALTAKEQNDATPVPNFAGFGDAESAEGEQGAGFQPSGTDADALVGQDSGVDSGEVKPKRGRKRIQQ